MVQGLWVKVPAQAGAWVEVRAGVEAEWADHFQQDRVEVVYARTVEQRSPILLDSLVMQKVVQNVVRK
jgi:hypothetical protein